MRISAISQVKIILLIKIVDSVQSTFTCFISTNLIIVYFESKKCTYKISGLLEIVIFCTGFFDTHAFLSNTPEYRPKQWCNRAFVMKHDY